MRCPKPEAEPDRLAGSLAAVQGLVFVTQLIDPADPVLGFVVPQIRTLATHCDRLVVIANEVRSVPDGLGAEVISLGKERGRGRTMRALRYEALIAGVIRRLRPAAVLAHMCPIYLTLAAPAARVYGAPTMLWFVHPHDGRTLRVAERLSDAVVTAFPHSYPRRGPKIRPIGHAIDTDAFSVIAPRARSESEPLRLLAVGRTSPVKSYETMIRAVALARARGVDAQLRIVGPSITPLEQEHRTALLALIDDLGPGQVRLDEGVAPGEIPALLAGSDVLVNATAGGSADKAVFEAMAVGRPVLVSSPAFAPLLADLPLSLAFPERDADGLASRICDLAAVSRPELVELGLQVRSRIVEEHSLDHWARSVVELAARLEGQRSGWARVSV